MKKILASVVALGCFAAAGSAIAGLPAGTGVNGSLHDMTKVVPATADAMGRVCVYCHAPHHAIKDDAAGPVGFDNYPLWNHQFSNATFSPYIWATPDNQLAAGDINDPLVGPSRLCMTCHDGNVAVDQHGSADGTMKQAGSTKISAINGGRANLTADLSNTHPIGFDYNTVATARNLQASNGSGLAGVDGTEIVISTNHYASAIDTTGTAQGVYNDVTRNAGNKTILDNLYAGNIMTCATCHEVHNKENATQDNFNGLNSSDITKAPNYFLYAKQTKSLICLSCHIK
jgi:hypothetical protein